ncbi:MAG: mechanosensitive ion channel [Muribaculaceae bacterium]|nr:mechanosensitive ion channel [Muribaculaceae bacterium]
MEVVPSHDVALLLIELIDDALEWLGLGRDAFIEEVVYVAVIVFSAIFIGWIFRLMVLFVIKRVIVLHKYEIGKELIEQKVFTRVSHIIPPLLFLIFIPFAFVSSEALLLRIIEWIAVIYLSVTIGVAINAILAFLWNHYDSHRNNKNHPLRGVLNVAKGVVWIIIVIVTVSGMLGKSPMVLLTGLGAFAAALMLVFRDSILGFVAGLQLSQNDMLRVGDWIVVPSTIANGIVEDVSLTVVKVRNWDNTLVMLPPYTLVSTSFQNWRGMVESKVRLMSCVVIVDNKSIRTCDNNFIEKIKQNYPQLKDIINGNIKYSGGLVGVNGTTETNLGLFRAYMCTYLLDHPMISDQWQILVNLLDVTSAGCRLQIYCYASTTDWTIYEAIKSEILEHIISTATMFELQIYNAVAGNDLREIK